MIRSFLYTLIMVSILLCGCEQAEMPNVPSCSILSIEVSAEPFISTERSFTRASENLYQTEFVNGDQIGITVVKDGKIVDGVNNICYTYNATTAKWEAATGSPSLYNYPDVTYLAYYPYDAAMTDKTTEQAIIDAFTPQTDQSTYANYTKSDLMTGTGVVSVTNGKPVVAFQFAHRMSLLVIYPRGQHYQTSDGYDFYAPPKEITALQVGSMTAVYQPGDCTYRAIVSPSTVNVNISYTIMEGSELQHTGTVTTTRGKYNKILLAPGSPTLPYTISAGDYFFADGGLLPGTTSSLTTHQQAVCIGIVCSTDPARIGKRAKEVLEEKGVTSPHGLVMALTNASEGCKWGNTIIDENSGGSAGAPFQENTNTSAKEYKNVDGYAETHWIINTYKNSGTAFKNTYQAFYYASLYGTEAGGTSRYAAPANTTGWFIPSIGQWWDILCYLGKINLDQYKESDSDSQYIGNLGGTAVNNMNSYLQKISGATLFETSFNTWFCSSSEHNTSNACYVVFYSYGNLGLSGRGKSDSKSKVRFCFAF